MKDLKNLIFYEELLYDSCNQLIRQAKNDGKFAIGYTCYHMPEVLLNLDNCFSVRMRAPNTGSMDIATYYMSNYTCEYARALLERTMEGGFNFLDGIAGLDACEAMNRCMENIEIQKLIPDEKFKISHIDVPLSDDDDCLEHYMEQLQRKLLNQLEEKMHVDTSDKSIRKAVQEHNEVCRLITEIGNFRKELNPRITGYEFHVITLATYCCPKYLIIPKLYETLEDLKKRVPDKKSHFKARVVLVGGEVDEPELIKLIEDSGAYVAADRFCYGSYPGRQEILLNDYEPVFKQICRNYLKTSLCPRCMSKHKVEQRRKFVRDLVKDYHADGVIYEQIKFCVPWGYERVLASYIQQNEYNIPCLSIDRPYASRNSGQLRTRFQAFVESLEIKRIKNKDKGDKK